MDPPAKTVNELNQDLLEHRSNMSRISQVSKRYQAAVVDASKQTWDEYQDYLAAQGGAAAGAQHAPPGPSASRNPFRSTNREPAPTSAPGSGLGRATAPVGLEQGSREDAGRQGNNSHGLESIMRDLRANHRYYNALSKKHLQEHANAEYEMRRIENLMMETHDEMR